MDFSQLQPGPLNINNLLQVALVHHVELTRKKNNGIHKARNKGAVQICSGWFVSDLI